MNKYWAVIKNNFLATLEYRASILAWRLLDVVSLGSVIFIWLAVYRDNQSLGTYNFNDIMLYYLLIPIIRSFTDIYVTDHLSKFIKDGGISAILTKPINILAHELSLQIGAKVSGQAFRIPAHLGIVILIAYLFQLVIPLKNIPLALIICVGAYFLNFFIDASLALLTFWMEDSWALSHFKNILIMILGGVTFPLDILPKNIAPIFNILPFKFSVYYPLNLIQERADMSYVGSELLLLVIWILVFWALMLIMWKIGMKKYTAIGG